MYTNNASSSTNQNVHQETNTPIINQESFAQKRLLLQQLFHTDQLLHKRPSRYKSLETTESRDESSDSNLGNDYPNAEPIHSTIPVVQNNTEPRVQYLELEISSRNDQLKNTEIDPNDIKNSFSNSAQIISNLEHIDINKTSNNLLKYKNEATSIGATSTPKSDQENIYSSDYNENTFDHVQKIEDNTFEKKSKISLKPKYNPDNIYASDNANQNIDNYSPLSDDKFISTNRKYYQDNVYSSNTVEESSETIPTNSKTKEVFSEGSKPKYYQDHIYAIVQKKNKHGHQTKTKSNEKNQNQNENNSKPKYYSDNVYASVQRTNGNQTGANSNEENIYENVASTSQLKFTPYTYTEDNINKGPYMRLTSDFEYLKNDPVEKNSTAKKVEKRISVLLKNRNEIDFEEKFNRKIGTTGNFDNFDGNVRNSILSLQSNESLDFELEEEEEPLRLIMQNEGFKNDRVMLCSCENLTLNKILIFMDKYKMFSWFQLMKILQLNTIHTMDATQIKLQNKKFELILAEWSYLKIMKMFDSHVVSKLVIALSRNEFNKLFGYLDDVIKCSENFLKDIEDCWQRNPMLPDFFNVICEHLHLKFYCYVLFCGGQPIFEMTLNELISNSANRVFHDILNTIHKDPKCQGLHLHAFLLKPYQKLRDFPSLILNAMTTLSTDDLEYDQCQKAINLLEILLIKCAKAEKAAKEKILVCEINKKLEFSKNMAIKTLTNLESRRFVHSGEVDLIEMNTSFFKKQKHIVKPVHLFLFNDLLVITRKSSDKKYIVLTYCHRIFIEINTETFLSPDIYESLNQDRILFLTMQQNHENYNTDMLLSFKTYTDKVRWTDALDPYESEIANVRANSNVTFQVIVKKNYKAQHSDEISLFLQHKIIVYRTYYDGWHFGQRISDKQFGWFPAKYVL